MRINKSTLLIAYGKDTHVSLPELERMPDPEAIGSRHRPYRYDEIVHGLIDGAGRAGYGVIRNEMALSRKEKILLGVMQLQENGGRIVGGLRSDVALGYRASTHSLSALKCVAGEHVFMCSNLIMSGEMFIVQRKFTLRLTLKDAIDNGFDQFTLQHSTMEGKLNLMSRTSVLDVEAKAMIFEGITKFHLPMAIARDTAKWYFGEEYGGEEEITEDCAPRTEFGLYNSFTRSLREFGAQPRFEHTQTVGRIFGL